MRLYYEIAVRSFRRTTAYRSAFVGGIITNAFFGAVLSFVYIGLYAQGGTVAGFSLQDALSYTWIMQSLISIGAAWIWREIMPTIRNGDVVIDITRPWSFYGYWLSRALGERVCNLLLRGSLTYLIGMLYFNARVPGLAELLGFTVSVVLSMLVSFAISFIINLTAFWLIDNTGVTLIADIVLMFFSGFLLPIAFFPAPLAALARALPFQAIAGLPAQVFLGQINGPALYEALALQLFWLIVLTLAGLLVQRAALQKVIVQGG